MALSIYDVGDTVRLTASYTDTGDSPANPTSVRIIYADPTGSETTALSGTTSLSNPATGSFYTDLYVDSPGTWRWRSASTGNIVTASEDVFVVRKQWVGVSS
jgi:hypothetical protein